MLGKTFEHEIINAVRNDDLRVPPFPAVLFRLTGMLATGNYSMNEVARLVSADQVLSALVLRDAASVASAPATPIRTLVLACNRIGAKAIHQLAVATGISSVACREGPLLELRLATWRRSVAAAEICGFVASLRNLPPEEAYLIGLLHDFGKTVALSIIERALGKHDVTFKRPAEDWMNEIRFYNAELGLALVTKWQLPQFLGDVIGGYHYGAVVDDRIAAYVNLTRSADSLVAEMDNSPVVTSERIESIPGFASKEESRRLHGFLPKLPALLRLYQQLDDACPPAVGWVEAPPTTLTGRLVAVDIAVNLRRRSASRPYRGTAVTAHGLRFTGPDAVSVNTLVELEVLEGAERFIAWVTITACRPIEGGFEVEGKPMTLDGKAATRWATLCARGAPIPTT
jgi:HD-like signal output (HDOD) protein